VRIKEEYISKTSLWTRYGNYDFIVVPFRLSNAPVFFMCLMNEFFWNYLDKFFIVFLDDIIIYSKYEEENRKNLRIVLQVLREHRLYAKFISCSFYHWKIYYLGHIIYKEGMFSCVYGKYKIHWGMENTKKCCRSKSFMRISGYYRSFIEVF